MVLFIFLIFIESFAENQIIQRTEHHVNQYSKQGLRTLVMAKRVLSEEDFAVWLVAHNEAKAAPEGRERLLYESYCRMERDLSLLGATGIEDKLQDQGKSNLRIAVAHLDRRYKTNFFNFFFHSSGNDKFFTQSRNCSLGSDW